jgi:DNA polymerase-3 subunit delta
MPTIMIIFLYGADTYRLTQKLNEIIEKYKKTHKSGLNLKYFKGQNLDFQDFKDELQQTSMFKEKKLIVLKNIFSNVDFKKKFLEESKKFLDSKDIILISETNQISVRDFLFKSLKKRATCQEFKLLEGKRLEKWAKKEIEKRGVNIEPKALQQLINFVGNDLWQLSNEIKKLTSFKGKEKKSKISIEEVKLLVKPKIEANIFKTIDLIASQRKKEALELIKKHLEKGDSYSYLLSMISFQFRNLLIIRDLIDKQKPYYLILKETGFHPYVVKKSYPLAKKFKTSELKKIYQKLFKVDLNIKTGKVEPRAALELLIAQI